MSPADRRRSGLFWLAAFSLALLAIFAAGLLLAVRGFQGASPSIARGSALQIDLALGFPEEPLFELGGGLFGSSGVTFRELLGAISRAKEDARIDKILLQVRPTGLGWGQAAELRDHLIDFKSAGKSIVAFVEYGSNREYFIASAANEIFMHPRTLLDLRGLKAQAIFLRGILDKLEIEAEFERFGAYKDAPDQFLRKDLSPESEEALGALIETIHHAVVAAVSESRVMDREDAASLLARGPFTAKEAEQNHLVDGLQYLDEVKKRSAPSGKDEIATVAVSRYLRGARSLMPFGRRARIAVIYGVGAIVGGESTEDAVFGRVMGSDTIAGAFEKVRKDRSIDAVVFRVDSPGGSDVASDVIWREAMLTREKKPVVVSMADVAASGGYWIATASDSIVAEPTTITGSIGIFAGKLNLAGFYHNLGISTDGVETSPNADFFSSTRSFTPEERERLRAIIKTGYDTFLERVAESRKKTIEEVHAVAQGRVWSGEDAQELGLVDELGGLRRAIEIAKERAGFDADARVELRIFPEKKPLFEYLLSSFLTGSGTDLPFHGLHWPRELLARSPLASHLLAGAPLALMPYELAIR
jgi:protease-4